MALEAALVCQTAPGATTSNLTRQQIRQSHIPADSKNVPRIHANPCESSDKQESRSCHRKMTSEQYHIELDATTDTKILDSSRAWRYSENPCKSMRTHTNPYESAETQENIRDHANIGIGVPTRAGINLPPCANRSRPSKKNANALLAWRSENPCKSLRNHTNL